MIPLPLLDGDTLLLDNSSLETFTTCPRAAQYLVCQKRKSSADKVALRFGGIIHSALEVRYRSATPMLAQTDAVQDCMLAKAQVEYEKWLSTSPSILDDDFRTFSCAAELIRLYGQQYPFESFDLVKLSDGRPFVEVPFALPLGEIEVNARMLVRDESGSVAERHVAIIKLVWTGRIDLAYRLDKRLYVLDHKTTSILGPSYFTTFEDSHQLIGYTWAAKQLLDQTPHGFVVNAIAVRRPTKTGKAFEFLRQAIAVSEWQLTEWQHDTISIVAKFVQGCQEGYLPKHRAWCVGKFGPCPYRSVCTLPPEQREVMLASGEFQDSTWSPLHATT